MRIEGHVAPLHLQIVGQPVGSLWVSAAAVPLMLLLFVGTDLQQRLLCGHLQRVLLLSEHILDAHQLRAAAQQAHLAPQQHSTHGWSMHRAATSDQHKRELAVSVLDTVQLQLLHMQGSNSVQPPCCVDHSTADDGRNSHC